MASAVNANHARAYRREAVGLSVLILLAAITFLLTRAFASANRSMRVNDAREWYQLAETRSGAGSLDDAVVALRRAVAIDRDNTRYRLALAGALGASGHRDDARQLLLALRQLTPEDPDVNLELARLETRRHDVTAANQYYQNALYGLWPASRIDERRLVRRELIDYLLAEGQNPRALSELLILSGNLPDDSLSQQQIGKLLMRAGDPRRALEHFVRALRLDPSNVETLRSAGESAFALGQYAAARQYFRLVPVLPGPDAEMRDIANLVVTVDPLAPRLSGSERYRRLTAGLEHAIERLRGCGKALEPRVAELVALRAAATRKTVAEEPELTDQAVELIGRAQRTVADTCGRGAPVDRAWAAIAARHAGGQS